MEVRGTVCPIYCGECLKEFGSKNILCPPSFHWKRCSSTRYQLMVAGSHGAAIALLYGIGGVGKTAIAKMFLTRTIINLKERAFYQIFGQRI